MLRILLLCGLSVAAYAPLSGETMVPLDLRFARISLANGRVLKNAALTSINRETGLVYVMEDRKLRAYPSAIFPGFITDEIDARLAEYPTRPTTPRESAPAQETVPATPPAAPAPIGSPEANAAQAAAIEDAVLAKAQQAALRHFRYGSRNGSGYSTMTNGDVDLDPPTTVSGWPHRYRVKGTVYFSFYDSVGETFQNRRRGVEVIVEAPSPRKVKVLEVKTDWSPSR
jgi:hypothetical protein